MLGNGGQVNIAVSIGDVVAVTGVFPSFAFTPPGGPTVNPTVEQTFSITADGTALVSNNPGPNAITVTCRGTGSTADAVGSLANNRGISWIDSLPNFANRVSNPGAAGEPTAQLIGNGADGGGVIAFNASVSTFDALEGGRGFGIWAKGAYSYFDDRGSAQSVDGAYGVLQGGIDYRLSDQIVIGIMGQGDIYDDDEKSGIASASGVGFLAGPYAAVEIAASTFFEAAVLGGQAYNTARTTTGAKADYDSDRLLMTARFSGDYTDGRLVFRPGLRFTWYAERTEDFVDGGGALVEGRTDSLGQVLAGPEVGYDLLSDERVLRPFVGLNGLYTVTRGKSSTTTNGVVSGGDGLSGQVKGGVEAEIGAARLRGEVSYSGIAGDDFRALSGSLSARIPLN